MPSPRPQNHVDWRLLLKEHVAKIAKLIHSFLGGLDDSVVLYFVGFGVNMLVPQDKNAFLANQPLVHCGGVSRGCLWLIGCSSKYQNKYATS